MKKYFKLQDAKVKNLVFLLITHIMATMVVFIIIDRSYLSVAILLSSIFGPFCVPILHRDFTATLLSLLFIIPISPFMATAILVQFTKIHISIKLISWFVFAFIWVLLGTICYSASMQ